MASPARAVEMRIFRQRAGADAVSRDVENSAVRDYHGPVASLEKYTQRIDRLQDDCPVRAALDVIRGRWKPHILCELKSGARRFSELQSALRGVTAQTLTLQLRQLEADGVVQRTIYPEIPPRVEYALSDLGRRLSDVMDELEDWGVEYLARRERDSLARPKSALDTPPLTLL